MGGCGAGTNIKTEAPSVMEYRPALRHSITLNPGGQVCVDGNRTKITIDAESTQVTIGCTTVSIHAIQHIYDLVNAHSKRPREITLQEGA